MSKSNDLIDKLIAYLQSMKESGEKDGRIITFGVQSGQVKLTVSYKVGSGRLTLESRPGDVILDFNSRKMDTISGISGCLAKAVLNAKQLDEGKPIFVSSIK